MNPLSSAISIQSLAHALGWTLLHFLWQGTLVALILACVLALLRGRSSQPRYLAGCAALVLMTILPLVTFTRILAAQRIAAYTLLISIPLSATATGHGLAAPPEPLLHRIAETLDREMPAVLAIWFVGVALLLSRLSIGLLVARRMMSATTQPPPHDLLRVFHQLAGRIGVTRPIQLLHSALVQVPTVIGWLRPVVLIPLGCLSGLSSTQVEAILAHELAHIRRHDYLISVLQSIVEALLFYHPAVWWVSQHIRKEREHCCDDFAVKIGGDPLTYARALSLLEEQRSALPAITLGANGGILTMRIKRLLGSKESPAVSQLAALTLLGIVLLATAVCIGTAARAQNTSAQLNPIHASAFLSSNAPNPANHSAPQQSANKDAQNSPALTPQYRNYQLQSQPGSADNSSDATARAPLSQIAITVSSHDRYFAYPSAAKAAHIQGTVLLLGTSSKTGTIEGLKIISGPQLLQASATEIVKYGIEFVKQRTYQPLLVDGADLPTKIEVTFILDDAAEPQTHSDAKPPGLASTARLTDKELYDSGLDLLRQGRCEAARSQLQTLVNTYPDSRFLTPAKLAIADSWQKQNGPAALNDAAKPQAQTHARPAIRQVSYKVPAATLQSGTPAVSSSLLHVSSRVTETNIVSKVNPIYPPDAKADHVQGAVVLEAQISKTGTIKGLRVVSGPDPLRVSAIDAVRQWIFEPYLLNGEPTEVETTITINYRLDDPSDSQSQNEEPANAAITPRKIGGSVTAPVVTYSVDPEYTEEARQARVSGTVLVRLWVDVQGNPTHVRVIRGIGQGLDEKAVEAVKQYRFKPAMEDGKPVLVELNIEVSFKFF
jgi:TonB family protein